MVQVDRVAARSPARRRGPGQGTRAHQRRCERPPARPADGEAGRKAEAALRDLREGEAGRKAKEALRDLRDSEAVGKARDAARDALRDLREGEAGRKAKAAMRDLRDSTASRDKP